MWWSTSNGGSHPYPSDMSWSASNWDSHPDPRNSNGGSHPDPWSASNGGSHLDPRWHRHNWAAYYYHQQQELECAAHHGYPSSYPQLLPNPWHEGHQELPPQHHGYHHGSPEEHAPAISEEPASEPTAEDLEDIAAIQNSVKRFLEGDGKLTEESEESEDGVNDQDNGGGEEDATDRSEGAIYQDNGGGEEDASDRSEGAIYCDCCEIWLNGPTQWKDHIIGKKHKKNLKKQGCVHGHGDWQKAKSAEAGVSEGCVEEAAIIQSTSNQFADGASNDAQQQEIAPVAPCDALDNFSEVPPPPSWTPEVETLLRAEARQQYLANASKASMALDAKAKAAAKAKNKSGTQEELDDFAVGLLKLLQLRPDGVLLSQVKPLLQGKFNVFFTEASFGCKKLIEVFQIPPLDKLFPLEFVPDRNEICIKAPSAKTIPEPLWGRMEGTGKCASSATRATPWTEKATKWERTAQNKGTLRGKTH